MPRNLRDSAERHLQKTLALMKNGQSKEALKVLQKAEKAAVKAEAYDLLLYIQTVKGQLMQDLGKYEEALKIHFLTLKNTEEFFSKDPHDELCQQIIQMNLKSIFALGYYLHNTGRFPQAQNFYERSLLISQKLLKTDSKNVVYRIIRRNDAQQFRKLAFRYGSNRRGESYARKGALNP